MTSSVGQIQLRKLISSMQPRLQPEVFVFSTVSSEEFVPETVSPICQFRETEGITLILRQTQAESIKLSYQYPCRLITLAIHSSLAAVGLLAAVSQALASEGISVNVVSAYYHDHLFVPCDRAEEALACLQKLTSQPQEYL